MIEGMREGIEAIVLEKCEYFEGEICDPKVEYMGAGARIFGDGAGELVVYVEKATVVNFEELKEKVEAVISKYNFEIIHTEIWHGLKRGSIGFKFSIKYKKEEEDESST
jgi:hypothetical protein